MEKSNIINVIVSGLLVLLGIAFLIIAWKLEEQDPGGICLTGSVLIIYGCIRCIITEYEIKK